MEFTRASRFHAKLGETFVLPEEKIQEHTMLVPGIDGGKMSKSKGNIIDIFLDDKKLRKQIMKIQTDLTPLEEPKNPDTYNLFALYKIIATQKQTESLRQKYIAGNYGYGHAKQELFELICEKFKHEREQFNYYMENITILEEQLKIGADKARNVAKPTLKKVREKLGY